MKKRNPAPIMVMVLVCMSLVAVLFEFGINVPSNFRLDIAAISRTNQEMERLEPVKKKDPLETLVKEDPLPVPPRQQSPQIIGCDRTHTEYDLCSIKGPTIVDPNTSTFFLMAPTEMGSGSILEKIKPYPRKWEDFPMKRIKEIKIISGLKGPKCEVQHNLPAHVFSAGGYTGNVFHDFNDGFIPLLFTINSIYGNQDVILVVSKSRDWWVRKYNSLLHAISKHPIIALDSDTSTHCFPSATLGLISYGFMSLLPNSSQTLLHFHGLLDKAFGHGQNHPFSSQGANRQPRLVFFTRSKGVGRKILNMDRAKQVAEKIGFEVILFEPTSRMPLQQVYALLKSSHALVGIHGAALTHFLFLRPGSVFMQVMPLGLDWIGKMCFGEPARAMGLEYIEYKINVKESTLINKYDKNDMVIKDPAALQKKKWSNDVMNIYLKEQNVRLDLVRFREYMKETYKKAKVFMDKEG